MTPFLFLLIAEGLTRLVRQAIKKNLYCGVNEVEGLGSEARKITWVKWKNICKPNEVEVWA